MLHRRKLLSFLFTVLFLSIGAIICDSNEATNEELVEKKREEIKCDDKNLANSEEALLEEDDDGDDDEDDESDSESV